MVRELLLSDGIECFSFRRAAAYARTLRFLSRVTLPEGMIDYARNIPDREIELVAPSANLVIREDLHPALVDLLVQSAESIHAGGGVFEEPGAFPTPDFIDLPLNAEARRFYVYGPPFLQRYLPFWLATLVDRLKVMLIPLVALLIPVFRLFPPIYRWRIARFGSPRLPIRARSLVSRFLAGARYIPAAIPPRGAPCRSRPGRFARLSFVFSRSAAIAACRALPWSPNPIRR